MTGDRAAWPSETLPSPAGREDGDPYRTYRRVGTVMAVALLALVLVELTRNALHPTDRDFLSFWSAGRLALAGVPAEAYDREALRAVQAGAATLSRGELPFPYPPAFLLLVAPFALLPFPAAMAA